ncbi:MAG: ribosome maturation factor RimM [Gammaproteobacteria bacterium]
MDDNNWIVMGRIAGLYGVKGWVKVHSYTDPHRGILDYDPLYIAAAESWRELAIEDGREHGKAIVIKVRDIDDRDQAATLVGQDLAVQRQQLPALDDDEVYWADLEGLEVVNLEGINLGRIERLFQTGANDVMVIRGERERLVPFLRDQVIKQIDFANRRIDVDWDADF